MRCLVLVIGIALTAMATTAHADPCTAIPDHGPAPAYLSPGSSFSGRVAYIGDGDSLCVALGPTPDRWVEVRLADFFAPELHGAGGEDAKLTLWRLAYGRDATCIADHQNHDRMVATCRIGGRSIGEMMQSAGVQEGGNAYRPTTSSRIPSAPPRRLASQVAPFRSCAAARAAGAAPMYRGEAGYNPQLDGDGDGIACEPYRPR